MSRLSKQCFLLVAILFTFTTTCYGHYGDQWLISRSHIVDPHIYGKVNTLPQADISSSNSLCDTFYEDKKEKDDNYKDKDENYTDKALTASLMQALPCGPLFASCSAPEGEGDMTFLIGFLAHIISNRCFRQDPNYYLVSSGMAAIPTWLYLSYKKMRAANL